LNKLLSQEEVDSLLSGLDTGDIQVEEEGTFDDELEAFDWATQGKDIRGTMPILEVVNSRFSTKLRGSLSTALRKMIDVTPDPLDMIKFSKFQRSLPVPTSLHLFKMEPLRGTGLMVVESRLVFSLVEAFFGGSGIGSTRIEGRDFTSIENKIIRKVVQIALMNMIEAWEEFHPIKTEFIRSESNPLVVNVVPGDELLLASKFEIELNKPLGSITICVPYASYQPIRHKLSGGYQDVEEEPQIDQAWLGKLKQRLMSTEIEVSIDLGKARLSVRDFLNLKRGDIIVMENKHKHPLTAKTEGIPKYEGFIGRLNSKKAFRIERSVSAQTH
jgi:flagellar motor switch protein FliM